MLQLLKNITSHLSSTVAKAKELDEIQFITHMIYRLKQIVKISRKKGGEGEPSKSAW